MTTKKQTLFGSAKDRTVADIIPAAAAAGGEEPLTASSLRRIMGDLLDEKMDARLYERLWLGEAQPDGVHQRRTLGGVMRSMKDEQKKIKDEIQRLAAVTPHATSIERVVPVVGLTTRPYGMLRSIS